MKINSSSLFFDPARKVQEAIRTIFIEEEYYTQYDPTSILIIRSEYSARTGVGTIIAKRKNGVQEKFFFDYDRNRFRLEYHGHNYWLDTHFNQWLLEPPNVFEKNIKTVCTPPV